MAASDANMGLGIREEGEIQGTPYLKIRGKRGRTVRHPGEFRY